MPAAGAQAVRSPAPPSEPAEIVVCLREDRPFFYRSADGGWAGFEYDLLTAFAESRDLRLRWLDPGSFLKLFGALERGECALGVSRITRTEEREKRFDFSPGYFPVRILAVERKGSTTVLPEQLQGKTAVTIPGSTYLKAIDSIGGDIEKLWVETTHDMFQAVTDGRADFLACDSAVVLALMTEYPDVRIAVPLSERSEIAFALEKGSEWTEPLTRFMNEFKADGLLRALLVEYFGEEGADLILSDSEPADEPSEAVK